MRLFRKFVAACALVLGAAYASAAPMSPDPTGMWYDPGEPGWGLSLSQQGDNIFAVLFVYDANHQPEWFVASNVVGTGILVPGNSYGEIFSGALYRTTGPYFASGSDSTPMLAAPVGTLQLILGGLPGNPNPTKLVVTYTVNGTLITKTVQPQVWSDLSSAFGTYDGGFVKTTASGTCTASQVATLAPNPAQFALEMDGPRFAITWGTGSNMCSLSGPPNLLGPLTNVSGPWFCLKGANGTFTLSNLSVGTYGFTSNLSLGASGGCVISTTIGGVKD
ncbi:MAG: hypothetical protein WA190_04125 [Usitatibacter sp.]